MSRDLDQLIADALDEVAGDAPELGPPPHLIGPVAESARSWPWLATGAVAAATIGITVAGLMLLSPSTADPDPVQSPTDSMVEPPSSAAPLSTAGPDESTALPAPDLDALAAGGWLVAGGLPDGYEMIRAWSTFADHQVVYANALGDQVLVSAVATAGAEGAAPDPDGWIVGVGEPVSAAYRGGGWSIDVSATALAPSELRDFVGELGVVREEALPLTVLDTTAVREGGALVASVDFNGLVEELYVSGGNGAYCMEGPAAGSCPVLFHPLDVIAPAGGGLLDADPGAMQGRVRSMGIAAPEVASIRFELMDGQTIEVVPTDLSGSFDVQFWLMASGVDLEEPAPPTGDPAPVASPAPIVRITALDADGNVLAERDGTGL